MRSRPLHTVNLANLRERVNSTQRAILGCCTTELPLTGPQLAARLGLACDAGFRDALVGLVHMGRLARPYGRHGYLLVRCRG